MLRNVVLGVHIAVGVAGLLAGPVGVFASTVRPAFHWLVLATCASAVALVPFDWSGLWFFVPIAAATYTFAFIGYRARGNRRRLVRGYGGAYIALWTAVFVVSATDWPIVWAIPTAVGAPLIEWSVLRRTPLEAVSREIRR